MLDKILFIDDDPITLMLCEKVIARASFSKTIITAKNGQEALSLFNELRNNHNLNDIPQLIFLDLNMPVMGGWEFLESFSTPYYKTFHTIKVVVLSSTIDPEDLEKAKKYPMVIDFLPKPINLSMLNYLIKKV